MINKVILVGNVGSDPEVKEVGGDKVASLSLATSESYKDKQGEKKTLTEWHRLIAWRGLAEVIEKYVHKGSQLYVEGKIRNRSYDDANGVKRYVTEIVLDTLKLLGSKQQASGGPVPLPEPPPESVKAAEDTDLPF